MIIQTKTSIICSGKISKVNYRVTEKGMPLLTFNIMHGKDPNDSKKGLFLSCKAFYEKAKSYQYLTDKMEVLVCGTKQEREYDGKLYEDCVVDLICNGLMFAVAEQLEEVSAENSENKETLPF